MFRPSTTFRPLRTIAQRRLASTSAESSKQAASETVKQGAEKASQSATDAFAKAQSAWANAKVAERFAGLGKYLGPVGDRLGSLLGAYRQPIVYNLQVTRELLKQIYIAERLQPPTSLGTIQNAYATLWARATNPGYWREVLRTGEYKRVGVYALEAYGIFKIGEILGRRHLIGYKLD